MAGHRLRLGPELDLAGALQPPTRRSPAPIITRALTYPPQFKLRHYQTWQDSRG
jgi:hypothetical protein